MTLSQSWRHPVRRGPRLYATLLPVCRPPIPLLTPAALDCIGLFFELMTGEYRRFGHVHRLSTLTHEPLFSGTIHAASRGRECVRARFGGVMDVGAGLQGTGLWRKGGRIMESHLFWSLGCGSWADMIWLKRWWDGLTACFWLSYFCLSVCAGITSLSISTYLSTHLPPACPRIPPYTIGRTPRHATVHLSTQHTPISHRHQPQSPSVRPSVLPSDAP